jgi:hypothetical protein
MLLDQLRDRLRLRHYSLRTEQAYVNWVMSPVPLALGLMLQEEG